MNECGEIVNATLTARYTGSEKLSEKLKFTLKK